jgi:hypothetical protein
MTAQRPDRGGHADAVRDMEAVEPQTLHFGTLRASPAASVRTSTGWPITATLGEANVRTFVDKTYQPPG